MIYFKEGYMQLDWKPETCVSSDILAMDSNMMYLLVQFYTDHTKRTLFAAGNGNPTHFNQLLIYGTKHSLYQLVSNTDTEGCSHTHKHRDKRKDKYR